ncbi:MAG: SGNH/GDSL hydrolase family protein [Candidatus Pacebacteria bacterium]|nr:SGNH/GDSL hydrolase family protein [Candidatus Paceibacterota bacterium]
MLSEKFWLKNRTFSGELLASQVNFTETSGWFKKLVLVIFSLIFIIGVFFSIELVFRKFITKEQGIFFPTFESLTQQELISNSYKKVNYHYKPFLLWVANSNQDNGVIKTNSLGYRDEEFGKKEKESIRIVLLGGSSVWGQGSTSNETTIAGYLEEKLNKYFTGKKVEVLNLGQPGYVSTQEFLMWRELVDYEPDLVIHYGVFNDIYAGMIGRPNSNLAGINEQILTSEKMAVVASLIKEEFYNLLSRSKAFNYFEFQFKRKFSKVNLNQTDLTSLTEENLLVSINEYLKNVGFIEELSKKEDIPVLFVFQPSIFLGKKTLTEEEIFVVDSFEKNYPTAKEFFEKSYKQLQENFLLKDNVIDGSGFYDEYENNLYIDHVHTSDEGYKIVAEKLFPFILSKLK